MDKQVATVVAVNRLMGDLYCLLHLLKALGIVSTLEVGIDAMELLAIINFRNKLNGSVVEQQDDPTEIHAEALAEDSSA